MCHGPRMYEPRFRILLENTASNLSLGSFTMECRNSPFEGLKRRVRRDKASEPLQGGVNVYAWFHDVFGEAGYSLLQILASSPGKKFLELGALNGCASTGI